MTKGLARRAGLLLASVAAAMTAMLPSAHAQDNQIDEITWALNRVPETLFIPNAWSTGNGVIMSLVQEGPLAFGDDLSVTPGVAESWEFKDPTTIVYHLRKDVTFSDGTPLTSADIAATMKFQMTPDNGSQVAMFYAPVASVETPDDSTVIVKLKAPNVQYQYTAPHMGGFIFKKAQIEGDRTDLGTPENIPLGTGPYKITEFVPAERVVLEARDDYWGGKPTVRKITIVSIPDPQARILAMQNGDVDGTFSVTISDFDQWKALPAANIYDAPSASTMLLTLNEDTPPFDDVNVRRAIAYSIDRDGLVKALLKGKGEALQAINPPEMWAGVMTVDEAKAFYATLPTYGFDMAKAKAALAASGHPDGFSVTVPVPNDNPEVVNVIQNLAQNAKQIGIDIKVEEVDPNQWLTQYFANGGPMQIITYWPDFADPVNYPYLFLHSSNARKDGQNASNFRNPEVDKLLDLANVESDPAKRAAALKQVFQIANDQVAVVPIYTPYAAMALNKKYVMKGYNAFWYNIPWAIRGFEKAM